MAEPAPPGSQLLVRSGPAVYGSPAGDEGWFGPRSVAWQVHSDLGPMLVGGLSALFLQSLHPRVMQGVADHSDYRHDPFGRLQRTAEYIAATTYGPSELAERAVRRVRAIHRRVRGFTRDGHSYSAEEAELLAYVHVTEVWSFLRAHQRYSGHPLLTVEKNRYLAEMSVVARRLGAGEVPVTTDDVRAYLRAVRPELASTPAALATVRFLTAAPAGWGLPARSAYRTLCEAAVDLLPEWGRRLLGLRRPAPYRLALVRPAAAAFTSALRFALGTSPVAAAAHQRTA